MTLPHPDYRLMHFPDDFSEIVGPYYWRMDGDRPLIGLRVKELHVSPRGVCHGAVLVAMADLQSLPGSYLAGITDRLTATVSFSNDFMSPAKLGEWIEMRVDLIKATRQFIFTQALLRTESGTAVVRSSGVYKLDPAPHPDPQIVTRLFG